MIRIASFRTSKPAPSVRLALTGLSLSMLMASLDTSIANAGLPTIAHAFSATFQQVQWIVLAYLLTITTLIVSIGRFGDTVGRKTLLIGGISLFTFASILCGFAQVLWLLIAARAVQGLGAAVMMALTIAFVSETVPKERIGYAMGLLGTMSAIGTALGPSLGGVLISRIGWQAIFLINLPLGVLALVLAIRNLPNDHSVLRIHRAPFDFIGTILLGLTLGSYALAMTIGGGHFGTLNLTLLCLTLLGALIFFLIENRSKNPLIKMSIFRDLRLSGSLAMSTLVSTVIMATLVVGPFYLSRALGLDPSHVGLILSVGPLVVVLSGVPAGRLSDRFGSQRITKFGLAGIGIGSFLLSLTSTTLGITGYVLPIVILTTGYALFQTSNNTAIMAGVSSDKRGVISGMLSLSRNLGLITGASAMGAVFAFASGTTEVAAAHSESVATGMRVTFLAAASLIAIALLIAVRTQNATDPPETNLSIS